MPLNLKADSDGVRFAVLVRPRSSQNRIAGVHDGALKIHLTAPPVEGAAGRPSASHPMGWRTLNPLIDLKRATTSTME